ncbi:MAG: FKBP-type peptidyl-prolyl cis-trans isomerase [Alteromonas naphthalenivorans]|jgi:FKBP-type peptidyl-prolyl cis-trans isomerase
MAMKIKTKKETMANKYIITLLCVLAGAGSVYLYGKKENKMSEETKSTKTATTTTRKTTDSGLGYEIITAPAAADAKQPTAGQTVQVHYTGWLNVNGQPGSKFDSSVDRGTPFEFPVGMGYVIKGWDEAVADMKTGEKRRIYLPSSLGYGSRGAGGAIPPNADLIFDVELLAIK